MSRREEREYRETRETLSMLVKIAIIVLFVIAEASLFWSLIMQATLPAYNRSYYGVIGLPIAGFIFVSMFFGVSLYAILRHPMYLTKYIFGGALIACIAISGYTTYYLFDASHYAITAGKVGVVTDGIGSVISIELGPRLYAEKTFWETVAYYDVTPQTEEMLSPSTMKENGTVVEIDPRPLKKSDGYDKDLSYGAIRVNCPDAPNVFLDAAVQWHIFTNASETSTNAEWKLNIKALYLDYPNQDYKEKTLINAVRDSVRVYAANYTVEEVCYTKIPEFDAGVTPYVQSYINKITTLHNTIVIDQVFIRSRVPPVESQKQYNKLLSAKKEAEIMVTLANAQREAKIKIAEGDAVSIQLVVNATTQSIRDLLAQNVSGSDVMRYLLNKYTYDRLVAIAEAHPDWKMTLIINSPDLNYTYPIDQGQP